MCGIAGFFTVSPRDAEARARLIAALEAALAHRGPDGRGAYESAAGHAVLVHRRLAIIDPGPSGAQPMADPSGRYRIVNNGEIFNYRELRRELESAGEWFATASDTEVLLRILARFGPDGLARVRGMFALALWDEAERALIVARDRFGIKPLYVTSSNGGVAFASELGALTAAGLAEGSVSPAGVLAFLSWASVPPPLTWLNDVESLEPGTWRRFDADGRTRAGHFADIRRAYVTRETAASESELRERVGAAVADSARAHLVADVPIGIFLSGGIDSSALVSAARSVSGADLCTYTVVVDDAAYSEEPYAAAVALAFGTRHHVLHVDGREVCRELPHIVRRLDQPTADAVNSWFVSRAVAATGVKAVLAGTGGDEVFGGYPSFRRVPRGMRTQRALGPVLAAVAPAIGAAMPARLAPRWRHYSTADGRIEEGYRAQRGFFLPDELAGLAGPALADALPRASRDLQRVEARLLGAVGPERAEASIARLETRLYLGSQLLRDIDAMSMAHSLEVRVPFVDQHLIDAVWPDVGRHPHLLQGKRLLHETLARPLPREAVGRPKQTFTLPFERWMRGDLGEFARAGLDAVCSSGWVRREAADATWNAWRNGRLHWSKPWGLAVLGHFLGAGTGRT